MANSFLSYALHYVILRTLYDGARAVGVSPILLVVGAVAGLIVLSVLGRLGGGGRSSWRTSPRKAYRIELARQQARRDARERASEKRRPPRWWRW